MDSNAKEETCEDERPNLQNPEQCNEQVKGVIIELGIEDLPPIKKRGRPRKTKTQSEEKDPPKKKARTYKDEDKWSDKGPVVPLNAREAVVTRTRTGRTPRKSIYGDDFVSPFDTKVIKEELDKSAKAASSATGGTQRRGRGRPPLKKVPVQESSAEKSTGKSNTAAIHVEPPAEIIIAEVIQMPASPVADAQAVEQSIETEQAEQSIETEQADTQSHTDAAETPTEVVTAEISSEEVAGEMMETPSVHNTEVIQTPSVDHTETGQNEEKIEDKEPAKEAEVIPVAKKRGRPGRGRPPKVKEPNPEIDGNAELPDSDLLEEDEEAEEDLPGMTEEEQQQLEVLDVHGENDFEEWSGVELQEALIVQDQDNEVLPDDPNRVVRHVSAAAEITNLLPGRCVGLSDCTCGLYHCPLCTVEYFQPVEYTRVMSKHLSIHEKYGVRFLDVICCVCRLDCQEIKVPHFHCPACGLLKLTKTMFEKHLENHTDVDFILDSQWRKRSKRSIPKPAPKKAQVIDEPVLSNVTAVLTTEFLEHIGAMENTESFLKEKLSMERVFVTKVSDQWIIHGQWEHIQKAYTRLKKLHKEARIQKLKDQKSTEAEETQAVASEEQTVSVLGQTLVVPKQEIQDEAADKGDADFEPGDQDQDEDDDPEYKPKPRAVRRSKDEIKKLGIKLKCRVCGLIKHSKDSLYRHIWRTHNEKKHVCSKCERSFGQRSDMKRHEESCKGLKPNTPDPEGDGPYKCKECDKLLQTRETLKAHHKYLHTDTGACVCHLCGKNFRAPRYLKSHLVRHSDIRNYVCGICGKKFKERGTLKEHLGTHKDPSERNKKFKCELCPKSYFRLAALQDHQNFHAGRKPYSCVECGKSFIGRCALAKHQLSHIETKTFDCDRCGRSFKFKHKLESHFVTHTGFSKHVCPVCGKCFTTSTTLRKHSCKGTFSVEKLLRNQTNAPLDPGKQTLQLYMCSLCNLTFTEWTEVAGHMLLHSEVGDNNVENSNDGTVQIELQSQDLINLADAAAASASLSASGTDQSEDMQRVINAIAQVQRMESTDADLDDVTTETERALAQIQYNQIQIQDNNIVNVIQEGQDEPRQVTIHLEDQDQYQIVQEQLANNPEQFEIIQESAAEEGEFQVIQDVTEDPQGQFEVIQDVDHQGNYQVVQGDGVNQGPYQIIQGEPGTQGQFQIIHSEASGEFQVIHGNQIDQENFEIVQGADDGEQYEVIQEAVQDGEFDVVQEDGDGNQFHVVPGSEGDEGTIRITQPQTSDSSVLSCNIGDIPIEQLTAVTHIAMDPAANQEGTAAIHMEANEPIYGEVQEETVGDDNPHVVVMSEAQPGSFQ